MRAAAAGYLLSMVYSVIRYVAFVSKNLENPPCSS
jgi:hypothetical protein